MLNSVAQLVTKSLAYLLVLPPSLHFFVGGFDQGCSTCRCALVATLTWSSVGVKPNTWKSGDLESSGTPECLELDSTGKNTSHWGVLGVIGKVLKRRYLK